MYAADVFVERVVEWWIAGGGKRWVWDVGWNG